MPIMLGVVLAMATYMFNDHAWHNGIGLIPQVSCSMVMPQFFRASCHVGGAHQWHTSINQIASAWGAKSVAKRSGWSDPKEWEQGFDVAPEEQMGCPTLNGGGQSKSPKGIDLKFQGVPPPMPPDAPRVKCVSYD